MSRVLYTSDLHFNHDFVAKLRGHATAEEHDEELIEKINAVTRERDQLWVLGDLGMGPLGPILEKCNRLRPKLHLVWGNHDAGHPMHKKAHTHQWRYLGMTFESAHLFASHQIGPDRVLLSHPPYEGDHTGQDRMTQWRPRDEGAWLLHGHVHDAWTIRGRQINVGVDRWDLPVDREELENFIAVQRLLDTANATA